MTVGGASTVSSLSDGTEAMSSASSDVSEDCNDVFYPQVTPPSTPTTASNPWSSPTEAWTPRPSTKPSVPTLAGSYDSSLAHILQLHRNLAQAYTKNSTMGNTRTDNGKVLKPQPEKVLPGHLQPHQKLCRIPSDKRPPPEGMRPCCAEGTKKPSMSGRRPRSHSTPTAPLIIQRQELEREAKGSGEEEKQEEEGEEGSNDDYGFLSHYSGLFNNTKQQTFTPTLKSKPSVSPRTLLPKRWRKNSQPPTPWKPDGFYTWSGVSGLRVKLASSTPMVHLSSVEREALCAVSLTQLATLGLGCPLNLPKEGSAQKRSRRNTFSLKKRTNQDPSSGSVFGIPLSSVCRNDCKLRQPRTSSFCEQQEEQDLGLPDQQQTGRPSSLSTGGSDSLSESDSRSTGETDSLTGIVNQRTDSDQGCTGQLASQLSEGDQTCSIVDILDSQHSPSPSFSSISSSNKQDAVIGPPGQQQEPDPYQPHSPQVPYIISCCCQHLEKHGLHVVGLFRVGGSKRRTKELRHAFDSGEEVELTKDHNPHDIASLLKDFLRGLPEPLLTRHLYPAFLATKKLVEKTERLGALRMLISLLPVAHRDTLWAVFTFLSLLQKHAADSLDAFSNKVPGNRMDVHNLATLFGPNLLHQAKGGEFEVTSAETAEDRHDVITVIQEMLEHQEELFEVPVELYDTLLRSLMETNPEALDLILRRLAASLGSTTDTLMSGGSSRVPGSVGVSTDASATGSSSSLRRSASCSSGTKSSQPTSQSSSDSLKKECWSQTPRPSSEVTNRPAPVMRRLSLGARLIPSDPPPQSSDHPLKPQISINSPGKGIYWREGKSPRAKAIHNPDPRPRDFPVDPPRRRSASINALCQRPRNLRKSSTSDSSPFSSSSTLYSSKMLPLPTGSGAHKQDRDSDSGCSSNSHNRSSSWSGTNSSVTSESPHSCDTPPASPFSCSTSGTFSLCSPNPPSETRPLQSPQGGASVSELQEEQWLHWERMTQHQNKDYQERETLV